MTRPRTLLFKFPGTNCDVETARALEEVGFEATVAPVSAIRAEDLPGYGLLVFPGGFSYGDYVMSGRIAQLEIEHRLGDALLNYHAGGGHLLGICNGFQILTRIGVLPPASLVENVSGRFVCRWVPLRRTGTESPFLRELPDEFELPVAHAEGRLVTPEPGDAERYLREGQAALTYGENFNGSMGAIAGLQDATGRAFGLMPHPERFTDRRQHYDPDWNRAERGWGHFVFRSIYRHLTTQP